MTLRRGKIESLKFLGEDVKKKTSVDAGQRRRGGH